MKNKTTIFEEKYGVNIDDFDTTTDVDKFIESKTGRKLECSTSHKHL